LAPAGATGDFPERHIAEALNDLKDGDLLKIQENLELLSDALKLWLANQVKLRRQRLLRWIQPM
jgi:hypothetical protein